MEETIGSFIGIVCTVAPCLLVLGGAIAFFIKRSRRPAAQPPAPAAAAPTPGRSAAPPASAIEPADAASLTPSEVVALRGDLFAPSAGALNSWKLAGSETKVSGPPLTQTMLAAAFLELERAGDARLEPSRKKALLGREVDTLLLTPTEQDSNWPTGSFEARILASARTRQASGRNTIHDIVFEILEQDAGLPWQWALQLAHNGMTRRGLLNVEAKKSLFGGPARYSLAPAASGTLTEARAAEVRQLLQACASERPAVAQLLNKEIKSGLNARTESSSFDN